VDQDILVQHVLVVVPVVQRVNFKLVGGNPVAEAVQEANIKMQMANRHVNFVVRVNTTTLGVHGQKVIVRTVQLVNTPALVLHHVQIVQLVNFKVQQAVHHVKIVQLGCINKVLVKMVA